MRTLGLALLALLLACSHDANSGDAGSPSRDAGVDADHRSAASAPHDASPDSEDPAPDAGPERCNALDDDQDGRIDEGDFLCVVGGDRGACIFGRCDNVHNCARSADDDAVCDLSDDDCDGRTDEDVALQTDSKNCGACGVVCPADGWCERGHCVCDADGGSDC